MSNLPWEPDFTPPAIDPNLVKNVINAVTSAASTAVTDVTNSVVTQVANQIGADVTAAVTTPPAAGGGASATPSPTATAPAAAAPPAATPPAVAPPATTSPAGGQNALVTAIEAAAAAAAKDALSALAPSVTSSIETRVASVVESEITALADKLSGGSQTTVPVPNLTDFTKADAWTHALRTFGIGIGLSALWGLINILVQVTSLGSTLGWSNPAFWTQVLTLAVGSVVGSVTAYVGRIVKEPAAVTALRKGPKH